MYFYGNINFGISVDFLFLFLANVVGFTARPSEDRIYNAITPVLFDDIIYNGGGHFDGSVFTCPTTGLYLFSLTGRGADTYAYAVKIM